MNKQRLIASAGTLVALAITTIAVALPATGTAADARFYLALGDSLSVGYQPAPSGVGSNTAAGYVNDLYAYESRYVRQLQLVDVGCSGDTTTSLATGHGNTGLAARFNCDRDGGSQLAAAVAFLRTHNHPGEVPLITIDVGINDLNRCADTPDPTGCLRAGEQSIATNTPVILNALAAAAPKGAVLVQMTIYDTYLRRRWIAPAVPTSEQPAFLAATRQANATIAVDDHAAGFRTADVAVAFRAYDVAPTATDDRNVPTNVAHICALTWACSRAPIGHNIHPNSFGYRVIAQTFEQTVGPL